MTSRLRKRLILLLVAIASSLAVQHASAQEAPERILFNGKIVTVDADETIAEAIAIHGDRILAVGTNAQIRKLANNDTQQIDLAGKTVIPGLIDSHVHATGASMYEFDHPVPDMQTIADVLAYVQQRAESLEEGEWIILSQVFVTRLRDQRFPTRYELDQVAPKHPVLFRTGPDAAANSLALQLSGIDKDFEITDGGTGYLERDPETGEPNGILRSCTRLIKAKNPSKSPTPEQRAEGLKKLFADYNSVGITSVCDRAASRGGIESYQTLRDANELTCRVFLSQSVGAGKDLEQIEKDILAAAANPLHEYNNMLWLRGIKIFLDGGMLTGSAYMSQPWGVSEIYSISDPDYRGLLYVEPDKLYAMAKIALANDLQFTAHSVGDGAVATLIDAYERIDRDDFSVREKRPCITHCNFMSSDAIARMKQLGIVADLQPAWLWLDGKTLLRQFGEERLRYFQPYKSLFESGVMVGGGSDHMQKVGSVRAVNPYNPFLGMWITLSRSPRWMEGSLQPEQTLSRMQALRLYTINNAWLTFEEQEKGSLEAGKLADLVVLKQDLLTCPLEEVQDIKVQQTYLGGKLVYDAK